MTSKLFEKYKTIQTPILTLTKPVIGIDRDGVINKDLGKYCTTPDEFEPIEGSLDAITKLRLAGHRIVIITNQGGISKGIMTTDDVDQIHKKMLELLGQAGCPSIDGIYYSTSSDKKDYYAKPNIGMFKKCQDENKDINFSKGVFIGDKLSDLKAAVKIGAKPILVRTGHGNETEQLLEKFTYRELKKKTVVFDSLHDYVMSLNY